MEIKEAVIITVDDVTIKSNFGTVADFIIILVKFQ